MISPHVSIVLSDRSWILERLGVEIQNRLSNIALNDSADPMADINYYITFACRRSEMPTLEAGFFTHMETAPQLQELFYSSARQLDLSICMSKTYANILLKKGIENVLTIPPGVDHHRFVPKLRIGVVGRTYHTGRKGEGLVAQLMDMVGIDWHFTGSGWPLPGKHLADEDLPDFYRSMDYILVPALYEGGPMCVPEALAVGTPVIASNVGWVAEFPHIPFKNGDVADLRRVLEDLLAAKVALSDTTNNYTWDNFALAHDKAFHDLLKRAEVKPAAGKRRVRKAPPFFQPVRLLMHGNESTTLGGPSVRVPKTSDALRQIGVPATASIFNPHADIAEDVVHLFNVWSPHTALRALRHLKQSGKKVVFSPIYLDLGERDFWQSELPTLPLDDLDELRLAYAAAKAHQVGRGRLPEPVPGYNAMVREMLSLADHVVFLSTAERKALAVIGAEVEDSRVSLVRNPVDTDLWQEGDPALFRAEFLDALDGPKEYVVCVGRIEPRKNQLLLARAMRDMDLRLVLVGHVGDAAYAERIRAEGGDELLMTGRLEPGGEMLRSALSGATAFCLPSWSEGASLAALEAAAAGSNLVLSDRSSEREYFGDLAQYCDPGDPDSIREALEAAIKPIDRQDRVQRQRALIMANNSWERYALDTAKAYAATAPILSLPQPVLHHKPKLVLDITTLAHHKGRVTGISRVESLLAQEFGATKDEVTFICWNNSIKRFVEVPARFAKLYHAQKYCSWFDKQPDTDAVSLPSDCTIIVAGSAWMQNGHYVEGLEMLKTRTGCSLISVVYDLVPFKFPIWFDKAYAPVFRENFRRLSAISDHILTDSESCAKDVKVALADDARANLPVTPIRLGDPELITHQISADDEKQNPLRESFATKKFVLAVGAIHKRKNYELLYKVWTRFADEGKHSDLHLVIVGGTAWNGKPLADVISEDSRVNRTIHILSNVEDEDLAWLYSQCLFTVFPSHYEGWGLPVAESLVHGKLCLATSSSSVPEIAPAFVEHIDPEDFVAWHQKISFFASSIAARRAKEESIQNGYKAVPWSHTANQIKEIVRQPRIIKNMRALRIGETAEAGRKSQPLAIGFGSGWHSPEGWGRWATSRISTMTLDTHLAWQPEQNNIYLLLRQTAYFGKNISKTFSISAGKTKLLTTPVSAKGFPNELILRIPKSAVDERGMLRMTFDIPTTAENSQSPRQLGFGLTSATLIDTVYSNPLQYLSQTDKWIDGQKDSHIDFGSEAHRKIVAPSLTHSLSWGVGSNEGTIHLLVPIVPGAPGQDFILKCRPVARQHSPVTVNLFGNGIALAGYKFTEDQPVELRFSVPAEILGRVSPFLLTIETDSGLTPHDLSIGSIPSIAGLGVTDLILIPHKS